MARKTKKVNPNFIVVMIAMLVAAIIAFNLYLALLPPIKNLKTYSPNLVTQFVSQDGEMIKISPNEAIEKCQKILLN